VRIGILLVAFTALRAGFLVAHRHLYADASAADLAQAFVHGLRFDLSAIAYLNLPLVLLAACPPRWVEARWHRRCAAAYFVAVNSAAVLVMVFDIGFYPFAGTRLTADASVFLPDLRAQAGQLAASYAGLAVLGLAAVGGLWAIAPRPAVVQAPRGWRWLPAAALALVATVVAARGGTQRRPINAIAAFPHGNHDLGILTLNSAFTLLQSKSGNRLQPERFFADRATVDSLLGTGYGAVPPGPGGRPRPNIVLLVLESFGAEYWGAPRRAHPELTPFLDSLRGQGAFFATGFANGRFSMDALPALLMGVPRLGSHNIALGEYQANRWIGVGHRLSAAGYHTAFFHGAKKGTMYFDALAALAGIEDFYPLERFPADAQAQFDGHWGIFDEEALQFAVQRVGEFREPWFSVMFTISTHNPYVVPARYRDSLPRGSLPIHQNVAYTDLALRRFFEVARRQPWYGHTLFIVTGDHTAPMRTPRYDTPVGRFLVPMLLFEPGGRLPPLDTARVVQHVDVFRTVLDWAGDRWADAPRFGRSLFAADAPGEALVAADREFWLTRRDGVLHRSPSGEERLVAFAHEQTGFARDAVAPRVAGDSAARSARLKAYLQYFSTSLVENSLYASAGGGSPSARRPSVVRR
jgi:phosphoglycerol transferase MdoB-like AlkP superfamily enzyme